MAKKTYQLTPEQQEKAMQLPEILKSKGYNVVVETGHFYPCPACGGDGIYQYPDEEGFLVTEECGCCAGTGEVAELGCDVGPLV